MSSVPLRYNVGAKLFMADALRAGSRREVTVTKVGRKYAEVDGGERVGGARIEIATSKVLGGSGSRIYASLAAYEAEQKLMQAWRALAGDLIHVTRSPPEGVTLAQIEEARRLLGLEAVR